MSEEKDVYSLVDADYFPDQDFTRVWYFNEKHRKNRCIDIPGLPDMSELPKEREFE